jgi:hypothetical protein
MSKLHRRTGYLGSGWIVLALGQQRDNASICGDPHSIRNRGAGKRVGRRFSVGI